MRIIHQVFFIFSCISSSLFALESKSLEFVFDHTTTPIDLENSNQKNELSFSDFTYDQLKIENIGDQPIKTCFPFTTHRPCLSLENLASEFADKKCPLLSLYQFWDQSLIREETLDTFSCHPLDLLNFKGICNQETFKDGFITLCQALGIEVRIANVHGKCVYDFCLEDRWSFLDLDAKQFYLDFDNETLISSEDIIDDPFLLLRTKHLSEEHPLSLKQNWKELAHFDILNPTSAQSFASPFPCEWVERAEGFDLYPCESLLYRKEPMSHECEIQQTVNLEIRHPSLLWQHLSPFPIKKIENESSVSIELIDQKITLAPGEAFTLPTDQEVFKLTLSFTTPPKGELILSGVCAAHLFPSLSGETTQLHLGAEENFSTIRLSYEGEKKEEKKDTPTLAVINETFVFNHTSPCFLLKSSDHSPEMIWWQICADQAFEIVPSNFNQIDSFTSSVTLSQISETFLNPDQVYYFRVKGCLNGEWGEWSTPYSFIVQKPLAVEYIEFECIKGGKEYELNWGRAAEQSDEPIEYLIFGSNSFDFVPSIYDDKQINEIGLSGAITYEESANNLVAITTNDHLTVSGALGYYRIIARRHGQLSIPSRVIHVYDQDLIQPRNVLQLVEEGEECLAKRTLFPTYYPWLEPPLPQVCKEAKSNRTKPENLIRAHQNLILIASLRTKALQYPYEFPDVSEETWNEVLPYLLPVNHPAWPKLNRVFCQTRATLNQDTFKKANFKRWRPGRWSRVSASSHPEFKEYFVKCYCDSEKGIIYDWKKWIHRIEGAECIRECIKDNQLKDHFTVPHKWIYPLPKNPAPPRSPQYVRKNFILVCENMRILEHAKNEKMYKKRMTPELLKGLYTILQTCGLYDSVYCFNCPFCKDGRIAIIDCEYHHKWPVPFERLGKCFSPENRKYWEKLTYRGGSIPPGKNRPNPPRMDRRDVPR